jgi:HlyD family secretion protein
MKGYGRNFRREKSEMTFDHHEEERGGVVARRPYKLIGAAVLVAALGMVVVWFTVVRGSEDSTSAMATFIAKRGPLTISVLEAGAIKAKDPEIIRNGVEGRTSITYLIPEGTRVKKGDLLVALDVSTMTDMKIDQEIKVKNAEAAHINAKETLIITTSQAQSDVDLATLTLEFAKQDREKYLEGQYPNDWKAALGKIRLNEEELTRAKDTYGWSKKLFDEKYLSLTQLQADQLAQSKAEVNLEVAKNDANLLKDYTYKRQIAQLTSDVNQAAMALDRAEAKQRANIAQAKADLDAKEQEFNRQTAKLNKINDQLGKAEMYAPVDGMVVYATSSRGGGFRDDRRPLAEGVEVFERQELIYLPRSASTVAEVDVHEASLDKVHAGLPALVTVDALPGKKFLGTVARIAPLPDPQSMWMNPDLKVYKTDIALETEDPALRSGMSCKAEIIVEQYPDAVYIPVWSVLRVGGKPTAYVVKDGEVEEREIEIGLDNNTMVRVTKGISEGEAVWLSPPLQAAALEPGSKLLGAGSDGNDVTAQRITEKLKAANEPGGPPSAGGPGAPGMGPPGARGAVEGGPTRRGGQGLPSFSPEQAEQMRKRLESMTPEQRQEMEKMRERYQNATPEEREQLRQKFGARGGRRGGRTGQDQGEGQGRGDAGQGRGEDQGQGPGGRGEDGNP